MGKTTKDNKFSMLKEAFRKYWFVVFAVLFYLFFCAYYMGPSFTHCTDRLNGLGDSTAGPIWSNSLKPNMPLLGGYENATNYPIGENLYSPVNFAAVGQTVLMKTTSKIAGPVCGYNLVNIISYLTTSLAMFGFIYYLTHRRWIALLAGYIVAFPPYVQSKIGGHPSYGFAGLLILILWLTLHIIKKQRKRDGLLLAAVLAFCAYFDPYFILLSATVLTPVLFVWGVTAIKQGIKSRKERDRAVATLKTFLVSLGALFCLLLPIGFVRIHDAQAINSSTSAVRGSVYETATHCSNLPLDYLLPDPRNQILAENISNYTVRNVAHRHWCGFGESRVSVSLATLGTVLLGAIIFGWERINRRRLKLTKSLNYKPSLLMWSLGLVGLSGFLLGLPPKVHGIHTLSAVALKLTSTWRIFAREYLVVNLIVVILFAIVLSYFSGISFKWRKFVLPILYIGIFVAILFEYQITTPFLPLTFSYNQDTPQVYKQIRDDPAINAIAEYPLDRSGIEFDSIVYYLTMQTVHQKKLFNSAALSNSREKIQIAMKDLTDPQTLPALRYEGINYVVIHGFPADYITGKTDQLRLIGHSDPPIYALTMVHIGGTNDIYLAKIADGPKLDHVLTIQKGFVVNLPIMKTPLDTEYEVTQNTELMILPLGKGVTKDPLTACFEAKMSTANDQDDLVISVNGTPVLTTHVTGEYSPVQVMAKEGDTIVLHTTNGHNMRLNNLGCRQ